MQKRRQGRKFSLKTDQRKALLKSLMGSLIMKEKIRTTEAKAKEVSRVIDRMIVRAAKLQDPAVSLKETRFLLRFFSPKIVKKLKEEIGPRYKERKGGYTRIIKLDPRKTDGSRMVFIELVK